MRSIEKGFIPNAAEEVQKQLAASAPTDKYTVPEEIANVMMYVSSYLSRHVTDQELIVDGGAILT